MHFRITVAAGLLAAGVGLAAGLTLVQRSQYASVPKRTVGASRMELRNHVVDNVVHHLVKRDFAQARADFAPELLAGLSVEKLQAVWSELEMKLGSFKNVGDRKHEQVMSYDVYLVRLEFEVDAVDLKIAIGADDKLVGIYVQPPGQPVVGV